MWKADDLDQPVNRTGNRDSGLSRVFLFFVVALIQEQNMGFFPVVRIKVFTKSLYQFATLFWVFG